MSVLWLKSGYTVKYSLSPREIPRAPPSGFPVCSGYISPYIPPLYIIRIQYWLCSHGCRVGGRGPWGIIYSTLGWHMLGNILYYAVHNNMLGIKGTLYCTVRNTVQCWEPKGPSGIIPWHWAWTDTAYTQNIVSIFDWTVHTVKYSLLPEGVLEGEAQWNSQGRISPPTCLIQKLC